MQLQNENEYVESREKDYVKREVLEVKDKQTDVLLEGFMMKTYENL